MTTLWPGSTAWALIRTCPSRFPYPRSQSPNTERIETEIQLADSGYGQGQVLMNPIHLAALYTMSPEPGRCHKAIHYVQEGAGIGSMAEGRLYS